MRQQEVSPNTSPAGNLYDKYNTRNPVARAMFNGFLNAVFSLLDEPVRQAGRANRPAIHEIGCGEGNLAAILKRRYGVDLIASDRDKAIIAKAQSLNGDEGIAFRDLSIYECRPEQDGADIVVCCEVLEHLEHPEKAIEAVRALRPDFALFSVPREPLWRVLNLARGKYASAFGNTPGHINHWSRAAFLRLLSGTFEVVGMRTPVPWLMALCRLKRSRAD